MWDGSHLIQEQSGENRYTYIYTHPESYEPLAQIQVVKNGDKQTAYYHCDQIGIPRELTDQQGNLLWHASYKGWGELQGEHNLKGVHQPLRLQNQYFDKETGLHYNFFRYYEPTVGRFTTQDPIGLAGGENLYRFAQNVNEWVDPLGLHPLVVLGIRALLTTGSRTGVTNATRAAITTGAGQNAGTAVIGAGAIYSVNHAMTVSGTKTMVGQCMANKPRPCEQYPKRNVAKNQALTAAGISPGTKPIASRSIQGWEQYLYSDPNGGEPIVISHHQQDEQHLCPHWHAGPAKMDGNNVATFKNGAWKYRKIDGMTFEHSFN
ncbi:RHS repeat-associated core domain-containing protein [Muribacter muris]|uniref:RHS repeat-associated core domain-containing protein n=1 Tax=Muribacter muris TaxID=67855 RepID=UPI001F4C8620|nr:RHS repeat-associated core domain-containing protein [Muribacter muris]